MHCLSTLVKELTLLIKFQQKLTEEYVWALVLQVNQRD